MLVAIPGTLKRSICVLALQSVSKLGDCWIDIHQTFRRFYRESRLPEILTAFGTRPQSLILCFPLSRQACQNNLCCILHGWAVPEFSSEQTSMTWMVCPEEHQGNSCLRSTWIPIPGSSQGKGFGFSGSYCHRICHFPNPVRPPFPFPSCSTIILPFTISHPVPTYLHW